MDSPADLPKLPKNDAVNRFWVSVEPYCAEISNEDLKLLEEILKSHEDECEYYKIPALGKHYAEKWAEEDLKEEQRDGEQNGVKLYHSSLGMGGGVPGGCLACSDMLRELSYPVRESLQCYRKKAGQDSSYDTRAPILNIILAVWKVYNARIIG